jgi:hypothetical protein
MPLGGYGIVTSDPFRRQFRDVFRDSLAGANCALQVTPDRVSRHFAGFFQSLTAGADLRNRRNQHAVPALGQGFEQRRVTVFRHDFIVRGFSSAILGMETAAMIALDKMTDEQFERHALDVLARELGVDGLARFLRLNRSGSGDYTKNRAAWHKGLTVDQIVEDIRSHRTAARSE